MNSLLPSLPPFLPRTYRAHRLLRCTDAAGSGPPRSAWPKEGCVFDKGMGKVREGGRKDRKGGKEGRREGGRDGLTRRKAG